MPSFHGQGLSLMPKPSEINAHDEKQKGLKAMPVIQCVPRLAECAEQIAKDEEHAKKKHAFVSPASHAAAQAGRSEIQNH
jgi:hypothetical protein